MTECAGNLSEKLSNFALRYHENEGRPALTMLPDLCSHPLNRVPTLGQIENIMQSMLDDGVLADQIPKLHAVRERYGGELRSLVAYRYMRKGMPAFNIGARLGLLNGQHFFLAVSYLFEIHTKILSGGYISEEYRHLKPDPERDPALKHIFDKGLDVVIIQSSAPGADLKLLVSHLNPQDRQLRMSALTKVSAIFDMRADDPKRNWNWKAVINGLTKRGMKMADAEAKTLVSFCDRIDKSSGDRLEMFWSTISRGSSHELANVPMDVFRAIGNLPPNVPHVPRVCEMMVKPAWLDIVKSGATCRHTLVPGNLKEAEAALAAMDADMTELKLDLDLRYKSEKYVWREIMKVLKVAGGKNQQAMDSFWRELKLEIVASGSAGELQMQVLQDKINLQKEADDEAAASACSWSVNRSTYQMM